MSKITTTKLLREFIAARRAYTAAWQLISDAMEVARNSEDWPKPEPFDNPQLMALPDWQFRAVLLAHRKREQEAYKNSGGREAERVHGPALKRLEAIEKRVSKLPVASPLDVFAKMVMYATWELADQGDNANVLDLAQGWSKSFGALGVEVEAFLRERVALGKLA